MSEEPENTTLSKSLEMCKPSNSIDEITLQLMTNKAQYKKYISKVDPVKYSEQQGFLAKVAKYRYKIQSLFSTLLENPETQITNSVNDGFEHFITTCIKHIELKDIENRRGDRETEDDDEDVLFGNMEESSNPLQEEREPSSSYWGKSIKKTTSASIVRCDVTDFFKPKKN
jgi:hypothetical protein